MTRADLPETCGSNWSSGPGERPADPQIAWRSGWYQPAKMLASPNCSARSAEVCIELIVIHSISLPPGEFGNNNVQRLFTNTLAWDEHPYFQTIHGLQVSSHFLVTRDGGLWQFVSCDEKAWHAGQSSYLGRRNCNDFSIGIELQGLEGDVFESAQYQTLAGLCLALAQKYPIAHIAGHEHIAPGRKRDPGPGFSWGLLKNRLSENTKSRDITFARFEPPGLSAR